MAGPRVMISCGEASGDLYAAALVSELRARVPGVEVFGFGGPALAAAGADLVGTYKGLTVTGLVEAASVLRRAWAMRQALCDAARARRPDVFVAIDFPDFNFRLLPAMKAMGVPIVYYVSPQLWAWRKGRIKTIKRYVDRMLVLFPFEADIYRSAGVPVDFVGHPIVDLARAETPKAQVLAAAGLDTARPVVALLPGSRPNELTQVLPNLVAAMPLIRARVPGVQALVARAPSLDDALFAPLEDLRRAGIPLGVVTESADDVLASSDIVLCASGTATMQTALHGRPMVIVYRLAPMTYAIVRRLVRIDTFGIVNLVAGKRIVPELIQDDFTPERVASEAIDLLTNATRAETMKRDLAQACARLGGPGASSRAAAAVIKVMTAQQTSSGKL